MNAVCHLRPMDNWDWNFITGKLITNFPSESLCAAWLIQKNVGLMAFNCKLVCWNARGTKTIMVWGLALSFIWQNDTNFITTDTGDSNNKNIFIYYILFPLKWIAETQPNWTSHWDRSTLWRLLIVPAQNSVSRTHGRLHFVLSLIIFFYSIYNIVRYISSLFWIIIIALIFVWHSSLFAMVICLALTLFCSQLSLSIGILFVLHGWDSSRPFLYTINILALWWHPKSSDYQQPKSYPTDENGIIEFCNWEW